MKLRRIPKTERPQPNQEPRVSVLDELQKLGCQCKPVDEHYLEVLTPDTLWCESHGDIDESGLRTVIRPRINGKADRSVSPLLVAVVRRHSRESYTRFLAL